MKKLILNKEQYDTAKECYEKNDCMRNAIKEYMNIYNTDYDISYKIINAVINNYKYLEVK